MGKMTCGLVYGTRLQVSEVEDWLDANCSGDWDVGLADLKEGAAGEVSKKLEIYFELPEDRDKFKNMFKEFEQASLNPKASPGGGGGEGEAPEKGGLFGMMRPDKG